MPMVSVGFSYDLVTDVVLDDGSKHRVGPFGPRDLVAFEDKFGVSSSFLGEMTRTKWVAFLAYNQLSHKGALGKSMTFEEFIDKMDDLSAEVEVPDKKEETEESGDDDGSGISTEPSPSGSP